MEEARQIKVDTSEARGAEEAEAVMKDEKTEAKEAAKGRGLMDETVEVKQVTDSSVPLQMKSNRVASGANSGLRHRLGSKKKVAIKVQLDSGQLDGKKASYIALKVAAGIPGVESVELGGKEKNILEVIGDDFDFVHLTSLLRKKIGHAEIIWKKDIMEDEPLLSKEEEDDPMLQPPVSSSAPHHVLLPINEDSVDSEKLNGGIETEMETKAKTHSNHGSVNAELSSCTRKTTEWTLLITSLLLEGISAVFEQLGYALMGMAMAFLALLLSIIDLIRKARKEGITGDGKSLLPRFSDHSSLNSPNFKPSGSLVEYFGLAGNVNGAEGSNPGPILIVGDSEFDGTALKGYRILEAVVLGFRDDDADSGSQESRT
ncbi:unnamed protein product [Dovyalis caffra]|uniref:Uncharacterized protein n=1 Tax=Dovyalis caffra TaxID=77055 RepID=A0AAV1SM04_9ROSI|nr:unnamed protein product [Dovyalis caffra]